MVTLVVLWTDISESLKFIQTSDQAWRLALFQVFETVRWFGRSAKDVAAHRGQSKVEKVDVETVIKMIGFPLDLSKPESGKYEDDKWIRMILEYKFDQHNLGVITADSEIDDDACRILCLVAGRTLDMTFLEAKLEAEREGSTSIRWIEARHIIRGCERLPYPLDWLC